MKLSRSPFLSWLPGSSELNLWSTHVSIHHSQRGTHAWLNLPLPHQEVLLGFWLSSRGSLHCHWIPFNIRFFPIHGGRHESFVQVTTGRGRQGSCADRPVANWAFHWGMGRQPLHSHTLGAVNCSVQNPPGLPRARGSAALPSGKLNPSPMTSPPLPGGTTLSQAQGPRVTSFLPSRSNSGLPWPGF